ncbi:hypothetical protein IAQ61_000503 [Plenodomus lingam]|uniref:5-formyltetrahydrofolate cyclo-ligase n=1 Tax=Leptosphaeria maculans (strain JN3 / isolate v23.1.3 / race Av1-4-5-6-7-8) TaxID=985895 RepID=E5A6Z8_LEPMJ|nr:hypothetical protein LEMA_P086320.1 [Plenodomus lingam JN3]KAH9880214.1 hypothetical protein IAQ61_000503 [Plenodomus lingam]CBX99393.1 hypothetical protein LEMA_P086320.1 [Plenodomus lingam JN3]
MSGPKAPEDARRKPLWARVYKDLLHHAVPDSRFSYDFLSFTPDFRHSDIAMDHVAELPCYTSASTILITPDNSLEGLRYRALRDGKKVLVATYRLRRGFVLLDPARIEEGSRRLASCLDGMEKSGLGRAVTMAQLRDEGVHVDMCVTGALVVNEQGVTIWEGQALFEVQWALLQDIEVLSDSTPVAAVVHACQVVDEAALGVERFMPDKNGEVQCDFVVTPDRVLHVDNALKPSGGINFKNVDPDGLNNIPPLQELKGMRMMEQIMQNGGFDSKPEKIPQPLSAEEQMGISIVEKLMKDLKP